MTTTVTGLAVPTLDARIAGRIGLRPDVRRVPLFGLGCVAGAAGMARLHDYLRGDPDGVGCAARRGTVLTDTEAAIRRWPTWSAVRCSVTAPPRWWR